MLRNVMMLTAAILALTAWPGVTLAELLYFSSPEQQTEGDWLDTEQDNWRRNSCTDTGTPASGDWDCGDINGECDTAIICSGKTANLDAEADAQSVSVQSTGILNINSGGLLNLVEDEGVSDIDGTVNLEGSLHFDWTTQVPEPPNTQPYDHTISGDGVVIGEVAAARIKVDGDNNGAGNTPNELHLSGTIRGTLQMVVLVEDDDTDQTRLLLDGGTVHADGGDVLLLGLADMDDTDCSLLKVSTSTNSVLEIDLRCGGGGLTICSLICLEYTDTEIVTGTLRLDDTFTTENTLTMNPPSKIEITELITARFQAPTNACQQ